MKTSFIETVRAADGTFVQIEHVQFTPGGVCLDPHAHIGSAWKDAIGKPLTNARILHYVREGWYGTEAQKLATKHDPNLSGIVHRCACGEKKNVRFLKFSYLPKPAFYCPRCLAVHRAERDKEKEANRSWKEIVLKEFV